MAHLEIVAHRGVADEVPENTIAAFQRAIDLGADGVELDVRLTADQVPIVYHYFYLEEVTAGSGPVFNYTSDQLQDVQVPVSKGGSASYVSIPTLFEVLETIGGQIGLEIELKGPEPESPAIVGAVLQQFKHLWDTVEVTSYEPVLLLSIQEQCPGLATDLLLPRSEEWMRLDVVAYQAIHRGRLARARAVHLHPTQLSSELVSAVRRQGIEIHSWDVNDEQSLDTILAFDIRRIDTDQFQLISNLYRERIR